MAIVAGVDFGTLSVRVTLVDSERKTLGSASAEYPLHRKREDPDFATQSHEDHMRALAAATREVLKQTGVPGDAVEAIALDTTGSSVVPVDARMTPLDDYYLWCDHRAKNEALEITEAAHREGLKAIDWCGGVYSSEWGFAKLLHWLRHNPAKREKFASAFEHCDMVAATLCGVTDPLQVKRSICAMGHKWLWHADLGGLPSEQFLTKIDPLFAGVRAKLDGQYETSDKIAGTLTPEWARKLGLRSGIPIPVGAFDAHWDAIGAGAREKDVVNVIGTSTCIIGIARHPNLVPGVCGVVRGSVHPFYTGIARMQTSLPPLPAAQTPAWAISVRALKNIAPAKRASCASLGTTAIEPSSSIPASAASPSAGISSTRPKTNSLPPSKAPRFIRASFWTGWRSMAYRSNG